MEVTRDQLIKLAEEACQTLMKKFEPEHLPPEHHFHYHQGVFLSGVHHTWKLNGDPSYLDYIRRWVDSCIEEDGNIFGFNPGNLDDLQPGILLFPLYDQTGEEKYKLAMDTIAWYYAHTPTNPDGGFWHGCTRRNQMWLDGLYMAGPFMTEYGTRYGRQDLIDQVVFQASLMREKTQDRETGLWRHAWDWERREPWADPVTGKSPEFWGRSMGWVPVALLQDAELLPEGSPEREKLSAIACGLLKALLPWQDASSGLWYQVTDKGGRPDNWPESSCTCLYAAALSMAIRLGLMDAGLKEVIRKAIQGVLRYVDRDEKGLLIGNICIGTGVGDYPFYCARPTSVNDLHGVGAFLLMCTEAAAIF